MSIGLYPLESLVDVRRRRTTGDIKFDKDVLKVDKSI